MVEPNFRQPLLQETFLIISVKVVLLHIFVETMIHLTLSDE